MLSTQFQLSRIIHAQYVGVALLVVFIDIVVVAVVSYSSVSSSQNECSLVCDHNSIFYVFISVSPLAVLAPLAPPKRRHSALSFIPLC